MKCHTCQQELIPNRDISNLKRWECPQLHIYSAELDPHNIPTKYIIFWDDINKDARYKLDSTQNHTIMYHRPLIQPLRSVERDKQGSIIETLRRWSPVMEFPNFLPLTIKDDIIQIDNLIHRLLKLRAFS